MAQFHRIGRFTTPPDLIDIESLAREAYAHMPEELRQFGQNVTIQVLDFPTEQMMESMDCETPFDMLGLYQGADHQASEDGQPALDRRKSERLPSGTHPDTVYLFRRPILDYWSETGEELPQVVSHILFHEIGHHFGFSDDDMERVTVKAALLS
ncbi:metallopeptidase family protein [Kiloniella sp. b19]|uniref:metallopeptidase family protein n=1 Tax=Kiloniella sp. GXU_MW_B19 TaxID=3141326 RepID=UPI0031DE2D9E